MNAIVFLALLVPAQNSAEGALPQPGSQADLAAREAPAEKATPGSYDESEAHAIGMLMRCPVCQGMPIAESPSDMAQAMMERIRVLLSQGQSRQQVLDYFAQRYGEWVLLQPKAHGVNLLLWVLPAFALVGGAWFVLRQGGRKRAAPASPASGSQGSSGDAYVDAVRREVEG